MTKRTFTCGLDAAIAVMGGKWKGLVLFMFQDRSLRFGELRRALPGISERVLALQLREMETAGLLRREVHPEVPPRVEYSLTDFGHSLTTALAPLGEWGEQHMTHIERPVGLQVRTLTEHPSQRRNARDQRESPRMPRRTTGGDQQGRAGGREGPGSVPWDAPAPGPAA